MHRSHINILNNLYFSIIKDLFKKNCSYWNCLKNGVTILNHAIAVPVSSFCDED